jgi:hypothetical protein
MLENPLLAPEDFLDFVLSCFRLHYLKDFKEN